MIEWKGSGGIRVERSREREQHRQAGIRTMWNEAEKKNIEAQTNMNTHKEGGEVQGAQETVISRR